MKIVNKKAYYNYQVLEQFVAGMALVGSEVKSLHNNNLAWGDSFIYFKDSELWIKNLSISKYSQSSYQNHDELRERKLLLKKKEILEISKLCLVRGITIIPLEVFILNRKFKLKIGVCKGKKDFDKRDSIKKRDIDRELKRKDF
jgi:SsrA-binding protein